MDDWMQDELALSKSEAAEIEARVVNTAEMINIEMAKLRQQMPFGVAAEWAMMLVGRELAAHQRPAEVGALRLGLSWDDGPTVPVRRYTPPKIRGHLRLVSSIRAKKSTAETMP